MVQIKINLDENEMPKYWYNIVPDLPDPPEPPLNPFTGEPAKAEDLETIFPKSLIMQEMSNERYAKIPKEVLEIYKMWRPNPLRRAVRLEKILKTPAQIYYKYEGESPTGSHKVNSSVPQCYYNMKDGTELLTTETGAGQWGCALAYACNLFEMDCKVFMVRSSFEQKPQRKTLINLWGGNVVSSPSMETEYGREIIKQTPDIPGTLGIAITEAIEYAMKQPNAKYSLGSVLNHVLLHQTIIGLELKKQMEIIDTTPDYLIGCCGGGSNFAGLIFPFVKDIIDKKSDIQAIGVESSTCPSMTKGEYRYDSGDAAGKTPDLKMYTLGCQFVPPAQHAGGLRYHGMAPLLSQVLNSGFCKAESYREYDVFKAGHLFSKAEGIIPAPESCHAIAAVLKRAEECKKTGEKKTIVFNLSGHGFIDLYAYEKYLTGKMVT
ncbi:MAG: TrpB-like pyridoxal phosphate-dependent enzyme [Methanosarcinaceae archaeon]|nr:TrpB-like pyridoxal phosphate-dependent enzyme [Methanosarcinaceae archaeon]